jgi:hypothetical protein
MQYLFSDTENRYEVAIRSRLIHFEASKYIDIAFLCIQRDAISSLALRLITSGI